MGITRDVKRSKSPTFFDWSRSHIEALEDQDHYPLSFSQSRLWIHDQRHDSDTTYLIPVSYDVPAALQVDDIQRGFDYLIRRHAALRTIFTTVDGEPRQCIIEPDSFLFRIDLVDQRHSLEPSQTEKILYPFNLAKGPLLRAQLVIFPDGRKRLNVVIHHILTDEWSMRVFYDDLAEFLVDGIRKEPLRIQYKDFSIWQHQLVTTGQLDQSHQFWSQLFQTPVKLFQWGDQKVKRSFDGRGHSQTMVLSSDIKVALRTLTREHRCSLFMVVLASLKSFLTRYTGQQDLVIGTSVYGRENIELADQVGFYVNILPLRSTGNDQRPFGELIQETKLATVEAIEHQLYPFDLLRDSVIKYESGEMSVFPFNVFLTVSEHTALEPMPKQNNTESIESMLKFEVNFLISEYADGLLLTLSYAKDIMSAPFANRFLMHYSTFMESLIKFPALPAKEHRYIPESELKQLLENFQGKTLNYSTSTLDKLFQNQANATPHRIALISGDRLLSYHKLDELSNSFGRYLEHQGVHPGDYVGIMLGRSERLMIAILGILKLGCCYIPIDPDYPANRKQYIIQDTAMQKVVVESSTEVRDLPGQIMYENFEERNYEATPLPTKVQPTDLAYIIYTSGTTGNPKGVMIEHRAVANLVEWLKGYIYARHTEPLYAMLTASINFDASVQQLFTPLVSGSSLVIPDEASRENPALYLSLIQSHKIDVLDITPPRLTILLNEIESTATHVPIRYVLVGGDQLSDSDIPRFYRKIKGGALINVYGPTEATVDSTFEMVSPQHGKGQIIGRPIPNSRAYVLDGNQKLVGIGVVGELYIGGVGLSRGYLNRATLTSEKFIKDPVNNGCVLYRTGDQCRWLEDGRLEFLGRQDDQLKIRGYRIESGEVMHAIKQMNGVASVVVRGLMISSERELVCYYTGTRMESAHLREFLKASLPQYMIPSYFVHLTEFPLTVNGKIDYQRLPEIAPSKRTKVDAKTPLQSNLIKIWESVLGHSNIGINDNFFDLGGHSLKAMKLMIEIKKQLGIDINLLQIFEKPTIEELTAAYENASESGLTINLNRPIPDGENIFMVPSVIGTPWVFQSLALALEGQYNCIGLMHPLLAKSTAEITTLEGLSELYFHEIVKRQSVGQLNLLGYSMGCVVAFELARRLEQLGYKITLSLIDRTLTTNRFSSSLKEKEAVFQRHLKSINSVVTTDVEELLRKVYYQSVDLLGNYLPEHVIQADTSIIESEQTRQGTSMSSWQNVVRGEIKKFCLSGDHYEIINHPTLAQILHRIFDRKQSNHVFAPDL